MSAAPRELRILDGAHAGARVPVCAGMTIGCSLDNDVVLSDPGVDGVHVRLVWDGTQDRWHLAAPDGAAAGQGLPLGAVARVGPVRLTVSAANEPWPGATAALETDEPAAVATPAAAAGAAMPCRRHRRVRWAAWTALAVVAFTNAAAVLWALSAADPPAAQAAAASASLALQMSRAQAVLAAQQAGRGVRLRPGGPGQPPVVDGILLDDMAHAALVTALARLEPPPRIALWSLPQLQAALRQAGTELPADIALRVSDPGEIVIDGTQADAHTTVALADAVRRLLPPDMAVHCRTPGPQQRAERLVADLQRQGFRLAGRIERDRLVLRGPLGDAELPRWERWLVAFSRRHNGLPFAIELQRDPPPRPRLPFVIASVVGGPAAHVLLGDGRRLWPGGEVDGLRLTAVRADALVFASGRHTFTLPR